MTLDYYSLQALLDLVDATDSAENRRYMLHCAVLQANGMPPPDSQVIRQSTSGTEAVGQDAGKYAATGTTKPPKGVKRLSMSSS